MYQKEIYHVMVTTASYCTQCQARGIKDGVHFAVIETSHHNIVVRLECNPADND